MEQIKQEMIAVENGFREFSLKLSQELLKLNQELEAGFRELCSRINEVNK